MKIPCFSVCASKTQICPISPQLSFACSQPDHHSWLHGKAFCVFPASTASSSVTIYKRLTTRVPWGGLSPSAHQKSLPPLFSPLPCSPSAPQEGSGARVDWPLWSLKALLPRGKSSKGSGKEGCAEPLEREESDGHQKKGPPSPHNQPWVFLDHLQEGVVREAGTLGFEMAVARAA